MALKYTFLFLLLEKIPPDCQKTHTVCAQRCVIRAGDIFGIKCKHTSTCRSNVFKWQASETVSLELLKCRSINTSWCKSIHVCYQKHQYLSTDSHNTSTCTVAILKLYEGSDYIADCWPRAWEDSLLTVGLDSSTFCRLNTSPKASLAKLKPSWLPAGFLRCLRWH